MVVASGAPFNVTVPLDLYGTSILNDRPALVSTATCGSVTPVGTNVLCTQLGTFNTAPAAGQAVIPINDYTGPGQFTFNLRVSKTFQFGTRKEAAANGGGGPRQGPGGFGRGIGGPGGGRGGRGGGGMPEAVSGAERRLPASGIA